MSDQKSTIIITGGNGYIGSQIIDKIHNEYNIISLDITTPKSKKSGVIYLNFDITSPESIRENLSQIKVQLGERIHSVIHLAGYYNFNGEENSLYEEVNVKGTKNFVTQLKELFTVDQIIFSSSMLNYAPTKPGVKISEDSPLDSSWAYPRTKIEAEQVLKEIHGKTSLVILRIAAVYNDYGYAPSISQQIFRINEMHLTSFLFPGDKKHLQSALHVEDLAEAIALIIKNQNILSSEEIFSVAEDKTPTYEVLQKQIGELIHNRPWPSIWIPKAVAKFGARLLSHLPSSRENFTRPWMIRYSDANYDLDNSRIKKALNWTPKRDLLSTLPGMIKALKNSPERWYAINKIGTPPFASKLRTKIAKNLITNQ